VKFLFATTEVNKVPITVLSRCQRFDLKRITPELLVQNFRMICTNEGVEAEDEALALIAQAAEGYARVGPSNTHKAISPADLEAKHKVPAPNVTSLLSARAPGVTRPRRCFSPRAA